MSHTKAAHQISALTNVQPVLQPQVFGGGAGNEKHEYCVYDQCRHNQLPCHVLHERTGCKCFSITTEERPPELPSLLGVAVLNEAEAEISWCAPRSVVRDYFLFYQEEGDPRRHRSPLIHHSWRRFILRDLIPGSSYNVCIVAVNEAGRSSCNPVNAARSAVAKSPWTRFQTPPASRKNLFLPIVGSGFAILLVVILSLAVTLFIKIFWGCFHHFESRVLASMEIHIGCQ
uniref:LRRN4 C-terminal like n=1 Tax=Eptatretus burgeri TaxID=7764 RepID=A0A8C4QZ42_EPTBU